MKKTNGLQRLLSCLLAVALLSGLLAAGATASGEQGKENKVSGWVTETAQLGGGAWITNTQTGERYYTYCADNLNPAPVVGIRYEPSALGAWELSPETIAKIGRALSILYPTDNAGLIDHSYQYNGYYTQEVIWHFTAGISDGSESGYENFLKKIIPEADIPMVIDYIENGNRDPIPAYIPDIHLELQADGSYAGAADYRCTHEASHTPVIGAQLPEGLRVSVERGAGDAYTIRATASAAYAGAHADGFPYTVDYSVAGYQEAADLRLFSPIPGQHPAGQKEYQRMVGYSLKDTVFHGTFNLTMEEPGALSVEKKVVGGPAGVDFPFSVTLDKPISGTYGEMDFHDGAASFSLRDGEQRTAQGLPAGLGYEVTESPTQDYTAQRPDNAAGTIASGGADAVTYTNTYTGPAVETGSLTVSKKVVDENHLGTVTEFEFTVKLDQGVTGTYGDLTFLDGAATFRLKDGESVTASGLQAGLGYTVTEAAVELYASTSGDAKGFIPAGGAAVVPFTNTYTGAQPSPSPSPAPSPSPSPSPEPSSRPDDSDDSGSQSHKPRPTPSPSPSPAIPVYRPDQTLPDPNVPDSPDTIIIIDDNDVPRGYVKGPDGSGAGELTYIEDARVPLGDLILDDVPKTGVEFPVLLLWIVCGLSAAGSIAVGAALLRDRYHGKHIR